MGDARGDAGVEGRRRRGRCLTRSGRNRPPRWRLNARDEVRVGEIWRPETRRAGYRERDIGRRRARMSLRGREAHHLNLGHRRLAFWVAARIDLGRARFADFLSSFGSAKSSIGARARQSSCRKRAQEPTRVGTSGHFGPEHVSGWSAAHGDPIRARGNHTHIEPPPRVRPGRVASRPRPTERRSARRELIFGRKREQQGGQDG